MLHKISLTPHQLRALADWAWCDDDDDWADVLLDTDDGVLLACQGEARAAIHPNGRTEVA